MKVLAFAGGPVRTLAEGHVPEWGPNGYVYIMGFSGAVRVPAAGGAVEELTSTADGELGHIVHDVLPSGDRALVMVVFDDLRTEVRGLDLRSGEMTTLVEGANPRYLPSGHLVFATGCDWISTAGACTTMMAVPFDPDAMELLGTPVAIMDGLTAWTFSDDGKLYYSRGEAMAGAGPTLQLHWATRGGRTSPVDPDWTFSGGSDGNQGWSISPDGSMVALGEYTERGYDVWMKRLDAGPRSRLTFSEAVDLKPVWGSDSRMVTFLSDRDGNLDVWSRPADGTREPRKLVDLEPRIAEATWSPDGAWLLLRTSGGSPGGGGIGS